LALRSRERYRQGAVYMAKRVKKQKPVEGRMSTGFAGGGKRKVLDRGDRPGLAEFRGREARKLALPGECWQKKSERR